MKQVHLNVTGKNAQHVTNIFISYGYLYKFYVTI